MSNPKERHYWAQLRAALTAGQWRSPYPARTPNGTLLSWPELFRKFNKHCRGYKDVAEVASQTQALALLIGARYDDDDEDVEMYGIPDSGSEDEITGGAKDEGWRRGTLGLGDECLLPEERMEEAVAGYESLKSLLSANSNFDTIHLVLAYYAHALRNPVACISHLEKVPHLLQFQDYIPGSAPATIATSLRSNTNTLDLLSPNTYAGSTTSYAGSFASSSSLLEITVPEVRDGRGWALATTFRSLCLQGMSIEHIHSSDPHKAINAYRQALPLLSTLQSELGITSFSSNILSPNAANNAVFTQLRDMWRWVERLMWRAVILSAKTASVFEDLTSTTPEGTSPTPSDDTPTQIAISIEAKNSLWTWLGLYAALSKTWPPLFRAKHRSTVCAIHLRAFIIRLGEVPPSSRARPLSSDESTPFVAQSTECLDLAREHWRHEAILAQALSVVEAYRAVLSASTRFPRAREKNVKVEEFVELCVLLWEAGWIHGPRDGKQKGRPTRPSEEEDLGAGWVIDILQWAQTLTFNSSKILRHLTRLLYLSSPPSSSFSKSTDVNAHHKTTRADLAKRTFQLYIQVVSKAFEASQEGIGEDVDSDVRWIETLVFGARMLAVNAARGYQEQQAGIYDGSLVTDVQQAVTVLEKARSRLDLHDSKLVAEVLLAEGVVWGVMGIIGIMGIYLASPSALYFFDLDFIRNTLIHPLAQDPLTRPGHLHKAHSCLLRSTEAHPTPSAYYHLALSFARRVPPIELATDPSSYPSLNANAYTHVRSLTRALECAGNAVEGRSSDVRYWHLLGLLLTAKEDWNGAKEVLQRGAELDFGTDEDGDKDAEARCGEETDDEAGVLPPVYTTDFCALKSATIEVKINGASAHKNRDSGDLTTPTIGNGCPPFTNGARARPLPATVLHSTEKWLPPASTLFPYLRPNASTSKPHIVYQLMFDDYPPSPSQLFERHLQLRTTQVALLEVMEGPEGAEEGWLDVFAWVAERNKITASAGARSTLYSSARGAGTEDGHEKVELAEGHSVVSNLNEAAAIKHASYDGLLQRQSMVDVSRTDGDESLLMVPVGITISPATPEIDVDGGERHFPGTQNEQEKLGGHVHEKKGKLSRIVSKKGNASYDEEKERESGSGDRGRSDDHGRQNNVTESHSKRSSSLTAQERAENTSHRSTVGSGSLHLKVKRSLSSDRPGDTSKSKKVQQILKDQVHKSRAGISAVSRKIGGKNLKRTHSTPDFHAVLQPTSYQASSIHSRRRLSSIIHSSDEREQHTRAGTPLYGYNSPTPPLHPPSASTVSNRDFSGSSYAGANTSSSNTTQPISTDGTATEKPRNPRADRLMSNLWLSSSATFRRLGKIEQARGAIQEAEMKDESNPNVWVQLGLYYVSLKYYQHAVDALLKARFIAPDDVAATVHLSRLYLDPQVTCKLQPFTSSTLSTTTGSSSAQNASGERPAMAAQPPTNSPSSPSVRSAAPSKDLAYTSPEVDLAEGMLNYSTRARGWDAPEAWYYLSRAYEMQGRGIKQSQKGRIGDDKEGNFTQASLLQVALELSEGRGVRELNTALGLCV